MNKIVIISGSGGVGKSEFIKQCSLIHKNTRELSTVDYVKFMANKIGWNNEKDERGRRFLSDIKDALSRYDNSPNEYVDRQIDYINSILNNTVIFVNAREEQDIKYFVDKYNALSVIVTNSRIKQVISNHADADVYNYCYDYYIINNGDLVELRESASSFLKDILDK